MGKNNTELLILGILFDMVVMSMKKKKSSYFALLMVSYFAIQYMYTITYSQKKDSLRLGITFA